MNILYAKSLVNGYNHLVRSISSLMGQTLTLNPSFHREIEHLCIYLFIYFYCGSVCYFWFLDCQDLEQFSNDRNHISW